MAGQIETTADLGADKPDVVATRWLREIDLANSHEKTWRERAQKIVEKYRDEQERSASDSNQRFNILYANTEVLKGALYSRVPIPDCRRRFLDKDPVGRIGAQVLQRSLTYSNDCDELNGTLKASVEDMVLPGRGQARVRYVPTMEGDEVIYEEVRAEYVEWEMFRYSPAKRWSKVRWVAFGELLTREDLRTQFPDVADKVTLDWMPKGKEDTEENQLFKRALVWTIWNKTDRKVYVVSTGYKDAPLKVAPDPLRLEHFFPCPPPLYDISNTNSLIPIPEYAIYQDQAMQLEDIENRISVLTEALRRRGVYDSSIPELQNLAKGGDNEFVPVPEYAKFMDKGGLEAAFQELPIEGLAKVLVQLMDQAERKKAAIYELIGLSDIMRGTSKATETLGAQQLKSQYGEIRIGPRQGEVQRFARDLMRLKAEIISEHFKPETLALTTGFDMFMTVAEKQQAQALIAPPPAAPGMPPAQPPAPPDPLLVEKLARPTWDEVMQILRSDKLRGFRIDIETDSTIKPQADEEQKNRIDLLTACSGFLEKAGPAVQAGMMPVKVATQLLMFGVRAFRTGPELEETLDEWAEEAQKPKEGPDMAAIAQQQAQMQEREMGLQKAEQAIAKRGEQAQASEVQAKDRHTQADVREAKLADAEKRFSMMQQLNDFMSEQRASMDALMKQNVEADLQRKQEAIGAEKEDNDMSNEEVKKLAATLAESIALIAESQNKTQQLIAELITTAGAEKTVSVHRQRDGSLKGTVTLQ